MKENYVQDHVLPQPPGEPPVHRRKQRARRFLQFGGVRPGVRRVRRFSLLAAVPLLMAQCAPNCGGTPAPPPPPPIPVVVAPGPVDLRLTSTGQCDVRDGNVVGVPSTFAGHVGFSVRDASVSPEAWQLGESYANASPGAQVTQSLSDIRSLLPGVRTIEARVGVANYRSDGSTVWGDPRTCRFTMPVA